MAPPFCPFEARDGDEVAVTVGIPGHFSRVDPLCIVDLLKVVRQAEHVQLGHVTCVFVGDGRDQDPIRVASVAVQVGEEHLEEILNAGILGGADPLVVGDYAEHLLAVGHQGGIDDVGPFAG